MRAARTAWMLDGSAPSSASHRDELLQEQRVALGTPHDPSGAGHVAHELERLACASGSRAMTERPEPGANHPGRISTNSGRPRHSTRIGCAPENAPT